MGQTLNIGLLLALGICFSLRAETTAPGNNTENDQPSPRYYCMGQIPRETDPHLITTMSQSFGFAYRNALQGCRYYYPDRAQDCRVQCLRIR